MMEDSSCPVATIVISTKNRCDLLRATLRSAVGQGSDVEVIVIDDGSEDDTPRMVAGEFPSVRLVRHETSKGYIARRNEGAALALAEIIFSIDDDAVFDSTETVADILPLFKHSGIGAVALPYINVNQDSVVRQKAPDEKCVYAVAAYVGTAHAVRKSLFLQLGGYREIFFHQGEEEDFCLRLLEAGYSVALGPSVPIRHFESPKRDFKRLHTHGPRNIVLFAWFNVPSLYVIPQILVSSIKILWHGIKIRRLFWKMQGLADGYLQMIRALAKRDPVSVRTYKTFRARRVKPEPFTCSGAP